MSDISLAEAFQFCPRCGAAATTVGKNPFHCVACDYLHFFGPTCAVAGIVADPIGQVLMLRRAKDPGKGKLGLPGGFVDPGESLEKALVREVLEETALVALRTDYLCSLPNTYLFRGVVLPVTDAFFVCQIESFETLAADPDEVQGYEFVVPTIDHLEQMAFESNRKALEFYLSTK